MKKLLLLLLPITLLTLCGCSDYTHICKYYGGQTIGLIKNVIQSSGHICGYIAGTMNCFNTELCEEIIN